MRQCDKIIRKVLNFRNTLLKQNEMEEDL